MLESSEEQVSSPIPLDWLDPGWAPERMPEISAGREHLPSWEAGRRDRLWLLAYDIADGKRLRKVARCCQGYGVRQQWSCYLCRLSPNRLNSLFDDLAPLILPDQDRILAIPLSRETLRRLRWLGQRPVFPNPSVWVF